MGKGRSMGKWRSMGKCKSRITDKSSEKRTSAKSLRVYELTNLLTTTPTPAVYRCNEDIPM